jgi:hypothetical protein
VRHLVLLLISSTIAAQSTNGVFNPAVDCDPTPSLIRDAAKDAGVNIRRVCYVSDRAKFAAKASESYARDLDRVGRLVRVVVPFGHLLLINGTESAVRMAVRAYDAEAESRTNAARFDDEQFFGGIRETGDYARRAMFALKKAYTVALAPYRELPPNLTQK